MSKSEAHDDVPGLEALEQAVGRALDRVRALERDLEQTRSRNQEVEELLQRMTSGEESPARMAERLQALKSENTDLRERLDEGRTVAERLLARVRYLEEHG